MMVMSNGAPHPQQCCSEVCTLEALVAWFREVQLTFPYKDMANVRVTSRWSFA